jgi:hypothetical protein
VPEARSAADPAQRSNDMIDIRKQGAVVVMRPARGKVKPPPGGAGAD